MWVLRIESWSSEERSVFLTLSHLSQESYLLHVVCPSPQTAFVCVALTVLDSLCRQAVLELTDIQPPLPPKYCLALLHVLVS